MSTTNDSYKLTRKRVASLKPARENSTLYRQPADDPDIMDLANSIRDHGLQQPMVVTRDNVVVSGHRRREALLWIGRKFCPCHILEIRWKDLSRDERLRMLREHNKSRDKTVAEQCREAMIDSEEGDAWDILKQRRAEIVAESNSAVSSIVIEGSSKRCGISLQKVEHVRYAKQVALQERRNYWPLSVRSVHYGLLNHKFLRNTVRKIEYRNNKQSYSSTSDLLTRMRLTGEIPWQAIDDGTRPVESFHPFRDARQFVQHELEGLFYGYWRDLLQSQPHYLEVLVEKNTVFSMAVSVTREFQIPTVSGRGFTSIDALYDTYDRYKSSKKDNLILIILSDFDPEGEIIPHTVGRILRDDFHVPDTNLRVIKAGVTQEQIEQYELPEGNFAKESSSNHKWFVEKTGSDRVYELEALEPEDMLRDLRETIEGVLDLELFNAEVARENDEASYLRSARLKAQEALVGFAE